MTDLEGLILVQDVLTVLMVGHVLFALGRAFSPERMSFPILAVPLLALVWGMVWSYVPALGALRLLPPPLGQAGVILASVLALSIFWASPHVRTRSEGLEPEPLLAMAFWRVVLGMSVLGVGVAGALPPSFFWSVGIGDIAVGLFGCALLLARAPLGGGMFMAWNIAGLVDLSHLLILGAITLVPFFVANPDLPFVNLLPLAGVPILFSLHVLGLRSLRRKVDM